MRKLTMILVALTISVSARADDAQESDPAAKFKDSPFIVTNAGQRIKRSLEVITSPKKVLKRIAGIPGETVRILKRGTRMVAEMEERGGAKEVIELIGGKKIPFTEIRIPKLRGKTGLFELISNGWKLTSRKQEEAIYAAGVDNTGPRRTAERAFGISMSAPADKSARQLKTLSMVPLLAALYMGADIPNVIEYNQTLAHLPNYSPAYKLLVADVLGVVTGLVSTGVARKFSDAFRARARRQELIGIAAQMNRSPRLLKDFFDTHPDPIGRQAGKKKVRFMQYLYENKLFDVAKKITGSKEVKPPTKLELIDTLLVMIEKERIWAEKKSTEMVRKVGKDGKVKKVAIQDPNKRLPIFENRENAGEFKPGVNKAGERLDSEELGYLHRLHDLRASVMKLRSSAWANKPEKATKRPKTVKKPKTYTGLGLAELQRQQIINGKPLLPEMGEVAPLKPPKHIKSQRRGGRSSGAFKRPRDRGLRSNPRDMRRR